MKTEEYRKIKEAEASLDLEFKKCVRKFREEQLKLKYALEDSPENSELRAAAVLLAEETSIPFWFVDGSGYCGYDQTTWAVYIPNSFERFEHLLESYQTCPEGIRTFTTGESTGNPVGEWITSTSC